MAQTAIIRKLFRIVSQEWHANVNLTPHKDGIVDIVEFGYYYNDGSTDGETHVKWKLMGDGTVAAQLTSFADSWAFLAREAALLTAMGNLGPYVTPLQFAHILEGFGFRDATVRTRPADLLGHGG